MRLLFVKLKHIGDSLLLTPTLSAVRQAYPEAVIWVVVRKGCEGILAGCPAIDRVVVAAAAEARHRSKLNWWSDWRLIRQLRAQHFDRAFELGDGDRGRWIVWLSGANVRCTNAVFTPLSWWWRSKFNVQSKFDWRHRHRVEKDFFSVHDGLPLGPEIPALMFERHFAGAWSDSTPLSRYAVLHPGTRWRRKRWPLEKWVELGRALLANLNQLIVSVGPDPEEIALADSLTAALGPRTMSTRGKSSWAQLAALLYGAELFVGVDTAAMHLAAACQCPTVALFRSAEVEQWRPWKAPHRVVVPPPSGQPVTDEMIWEETAENILVSDVLRACREMLAARTARVD